MQPRESEVRTRGAKGGDEITHKVKVILSVTVRMMHWSHP